MKTTIDIPEKELADAIRFTGAKTKREAVVKVLEDFNRRQRMTALTCYLGTFTSLASNEEIERVDMDKTKSQFNSADKPVRTTTEAKATEPFK